MKIYTGKGDGGTTALFGGGKFRKDDVRIEAYGTIDELNASIGHLLAEGVVHTQEQTLMNIQNVLFDIGSNLATLPGKAMPMPMLTEDDIKTLENEIDAMSDDLPPLKNFILPGGSVAVALSHICRTVCRRAERRVVALEHQDLDPLVIKFLNRLSDYLFVLGRAIAHDSGVEEILWTGRKA